MLLRNPNHIAFSETHSRAMFNPVLIFAMFITFVLILFSCEVIGFQSGLSALCFPSNIFYKFSNIKRLVFLDRCRSVFHVETA
jgi:hypothetical protein